MIAVEVIVALLVVSVIIVAIVKVGAPIADAFSDRLKMKFQELGPEQERRFNERIQALEQQVLDLQKQVTNLQESMNFSIQINTKEKSKLEEKR